MVHDSYLSHEASCFHWWIFAIPSNTAGINIFDRQVLDTEAHTVLRKNFTQSQVVQFHRLDFSCDIDWSKGQHHARLENISLHSANRESTNTPIF
ncbi:unnamed protein product [Gulo gulo]|uniref:Uncharacterized protein n=1 Tax=Gulo gulo TaxID=48420 RepID=A0A9X9LQN1_GULGU|nr:unnamed protein product [Gulo gulo]